jgi:hypothetical protein
MATDSKEIHTYFFFKFNYDLIAKHKPLEWGPQLKFAIYFVVFYVFQMKWNFFYVMVIFKQK